MTVPPRCNRIPLPGLVPVRTHLGYYTWTYHRYIALVGSRSVRDARPASRRESILHRCADISLCGIHPRIELQRFEKYDEIQSLNISSHKQENKYIAICAVKYSWVMFKNNLSTCKHVKKKKFYLLNFLNFFLLKKMLYLISIKYKVYV